MGVETLVPIFGAFVGGYHKTENHCHGVGKSHQRLLLKPAKHNPTSIDAGQISQKKYKKSRQENGHSARMKKSIVGFPVTSYTYFVSRYT